MTAIEKWGISLSIIGAVFIIISGIVFFVFRSWEFSYVVNEEKVGQFGDFIGGVVGSIFALAGVFLYYAALKEQRKDISINQKALNLQIEALNQQVTEFKAQKEELQETRKVYEEQTNLFREQTEYYKQQTREAKKQTDAAYLNHFNSSFYSLLSILIKIQERFDDNLNNLFANIYNELMVDISNTTIRESCLIINNKYDEVFNQHSNELAHYFKTIYRLLKVIDSANIDEDIKLQYAKILRSQFSNIELVILYYNYRSDLGAKARNVVLKYNLLKHINQLDIIELAQICPPNSKNKLTSFIKRISVVICENVIKFNDIETTDDIDISESINCMGIPSSFRLTITDEYFSFTVDVAERDWNFPKGITIEIFSELFLRCLYDIFFMSKYKMPNGKEFSNKIVKENNKIIFMFKAKNQIIL